MTLPEAVGRSEDPIRAREESPRKVKLLVWDLDGTLWDGTLLEGDELRVREEAVAAIRTLDRRGILHSIASKNEPKPAMEKVRELGLEEYFLYPQIHWSSKASSVETIARSINIGLDAVAFIDDQPFERDEVAHAHPSVLTLGVEELPYLVEREEFRPRFVTDESARRREMYRAEMVRQEVETRFEGPSEEFLASLGMRFTIGPARDEDLRRAEELTVRTHQLNTTGETYSYEELDAFRRSDGHLLLVAGLEDRYGSYGKIGLALIERAEEVWNLKLLLMSCRVMSRGVGTILIHHILRRARDARVRLRAEFRPTDRNRRMLITYRFSGFREEAERQDGLVVFENDFSDVQAPPPYVKVEVLDR